MRRNRSSSAAIRRSSRRSATDCVREKNAPRESGRSWAAGEDRSDAKVYGRLPLDQDDACVECRYGHPHLAVREGSERARNFGL